MCGSVCVHNARAVYIIPYPNRYICLPVGRYSKLLIYLGLIECFRKMSCYKYVNKVFTKYQSEWYSRKMSELQR